MASSVFWECFKAIALWSVLTAIMTVGAQMFLMKSVHGGGCGGGSHRRKHHDYDPEMYEMYEGDEYY